MIKQKRRCRLVFNKTQKCHKLKVVIYLFVIIVLSKCTGPHSKRDHAEKRPSYTSEFPEIAAEKKAEVLIRRIQSSDCMYTGSVGIEGKESIIYASFRRLDQLVSDSTWLTLTYDQNVVMRAYAYKALEHRNPGLTAGVFHRLKNDTAKLCWISNDMDLSCTLGFFVTNTK